MDSNHVEVFDLVVAIAVGIALVVFNKQVSFLFMKLSQGMWGRWWFNGPTVEKVHRIVVIGVGLAWVVVGCAALRGVLFSN